MSYQTKKILKDVDGFPIPQGFEVASGNFREATAQNIGNGKYAQDVVNYGKTAGGLYVPQKVADDGTLPVSLTGSNVELNVNTGNDGVLLALAERDSATSDSPIMTNRGNKGILLIWRVTQSGRTYRPRLFMKDPSGNDIQIWESSLATSAVGIYTYLLHPNNYGTWATEKGNIILPYKWFLRMTGSSPAENPAIFSVSYSYLN